ALCAWHVLPNACVRTPTIPQVTHAVDKIVVAPSGGFWLAKKKPSLSMTWIGYIGRLNGCGEVPPRRFERPTHGSGGRCSIRAELRGHRCFIGTHYYTDSQQNQQPLCDTSV